MISRGRSFSYLSWLPSALCSIGQRTTRRGRRFIYRDAFGELRKHACDGWVPFAQGLLGVLL
jgi:hypothetical protein